MVTNSFMEQGSFISNGYPKIIELKSRPDWFEILNYTNIGSNANPGKMRQAYTQWPYNVSGGAFTYATYNSNGAYTLVDYRLTENEGFKLYDSSDLEPMPAVAITGGVDAFNPVFQTADTSFVEDGAIVRIVGTNLANFNGIDFTTDNYIQNTSFSTFSTLASTLGAAANAGYYRVIAPDITTYMAFYPSRRYICDISKADNASIVTTVEHGLSEGDLVRIKVPEEYSMIEMDGVAATVYSVVDDFNFLVNIDSTGFTEFTWPSIGDSPFVYSTVTPIGKGYEENIGMSYNQVDNHNKIAVRIGTLVAGFNNDIIYWRAGSNTLR